MGTKGQLAIGPVCPRYPSLAVFSPTFKHIVRAKNSVWKPLYNQIWHRTIETEIFMRRTPLQICTNNTAADQPRIQFLALLLQQVSAEFW